MPLNESSRHQSGILTDMSNSASMYFSANREEFTHEMRKVIVFVKLINLFP